LKENLPGYQETDLAGQFDEDDGSGEFEFSILNQTNSHPYIDTEKYDVSTASPEVFYDVLELNESFTIPLFVIENGKLNEVKKFRVYYYVDFTKSDINLSDVSGWDVLRWKINGLTKTRGFGDEITESINDFTGVTLSDSGNVTMASMPNWFGSVSDCSDSGDASGKIQCLEYSEPQTAEYKHFGDIDGGYDSYVGNCMPWQAREYYIYSNRKITGVSPCYDISIFLENHQYNYLTLTNLMNPKVFNSQVNKPELSKIYFRLEVYGDSKIPLKYAEISSVGRSGDSEIVLNVLKSKGEGLPVLNFALYHIDK